MPPGNPDSYLRTNRRYESVWMRAPSVPANSENDRIVRDFHPTWGVQDSNAPTGIQETSP
jgi:hypothetical protein